jgi:hypothetical protein
MCRKFWLGDLKIKASWKDTGVEGRMILKFILCRRLGVSFVLIRIRDVCWLLWAQVGKMKGGEFHDSARDC